MPIIHSQSAIKLTTTQHSLPCLSPPRICVNVMLPLFYRDRPDVAVDDLPSALLKPTFCDACDKKGTPHKTANVYCVVCDTKLCNAHREVS